MIEQKDIDDVLHDLISVWHDANGIDGIELHQFLGFTWDEYAAWVGPDVEDRVIPERLHGYLRWLHARSCVTPVDGMTRERFADLERIRELAKDGGTVSHFVLKEALIEISRCWARGLAPGVVNRPDPGGPRDGHTFEIAVRSRMASSIVDDDSSYQDANWWDRPHVCYFRASSLHDALRQAVALPFTTWMAHLNQSPPEEPM